MSAFGQVKHIRFSGKQLKHERVFVVFGLLKAIVAPLSRCTLLYMVFSGTNKLPECADE